MPRWIQVGGTYWRVCTVVRTARTTNMKFGRNLSQFTVPEWSASYIKYKALKKLIKSAAEQIKAGQEADLAGKPGALQIVSCAVALLTRMPCFFCSFRLGF